MKTRSIKERLAELSEQEERAIEKANQYKERRRALEKKQKVEEKKARDHRLIEIGAVAEHVFGDAITKDELPRFQAFLERGDAKGNYFKRAMNK